MTTDRINAASPDAAPVTVPGWCQRPGSDTPIHRRAESCDLVGVVTPGTRCVELRLPAGLVAELRGVASEAEIENWERGLWKSHGDIEEDA